MTTLIIIWLSFGFFSYWPLVFHYKINALSINAPYWEWLAAWAVWSVCWPYRYTMDAWYWWRAKK